MLRFAEGNKLDRLLNLYLEGNLPQATCSEGSETPRLLVFGLDGKAELPTLAS
jgi:hypothetical protein